MTGINFYPFKFSISKIQGLLSDQVAKMGLPLCLTICLPVFMQAVVQEKEKKLTEIMKINGLQMNNYWIVNYWFNFVYYMIMAFLWYAAGAYIFQMKVFVHTSATLFWVILTGWGLSQISFAFFLSVFL